MTLPELTPPDQVIFRQILHAAEHHRLCLYGAVRLDNGGVDPLICGINAHVGEDGTRYQLVPFARLIQDDPYEVYEEPAQEIYHAIREWAENDGPGEVQIFKEGPDDA